MNDKLLHSEEPELPFQLSAEIPSLGDDVSRIDSRKSMSSINCREPCGDEGLYEKVVNEWLQPDDHRKQKQRIAIVGPAQIGKKHLLKSLLRQVRTRYDYIFYVSLKFVKFSDEMNILQFLLANESGLRWMDCKTPVDFQLFKRVVERLHNAQLSKVCIIMDDIDKSEYVYKKYVYDKGLFDKTKAGYIVSNILRHWFKNGQKILLLRPWEYFQLSVNDVLHPTHVIYVKGIDHKAQKMLAKESFMLGCRRTGCQLRNACLGVIATVHEPAECSLCKSNFQNNCHFEIQSLCYLPYNCKLLVQHQTFLLSSTIFIVTSIMLHEISRNNELSLSTPFWEKIGYFAWENYAQGLFVFGEGDLLTSDLNRNEINFFFNCGTENPQLFSDCGYDLVFFFSHILQQELLASLWLLSLPIEQFTKQVQNNKESFMNGSFAVICDFMSVICNDLLLKKYHKIFFKQHSIENFEYLQSFMVDDNTGTCSLLLSDKERPQTASLLITRVRQPIEDMILTETYKSVLADAEVKIAKILHCHGVPGSGKSEIVRKLAENFPFAEDSSEGLIKWHIQCKDSGHDLLQELKVLTEKLLKQSNKVDQEKHQKVVDNLSRLEANELVDVLIDINLPVLIMVEDPPFEERLLVSLCKNLRDRSRIETITKKFHVYISSRQSISLLTGQHQHIPEYSLVQVVGFNEQEAKTYLKVGQSQDNHEAAVKIFRRFKGLPLGLQFAKGYCRIVKIDLWEYIDLVEDPEYDFTSEESKKVIMDYGESALPVFQAIALPFFPIEDNDPKAILSWKILCCISYFHYDRIPRFALEQSCHVLREGKVKKPSIKNRIEISKLNTKLVEHGICKETDKGDITFHEIVINAFRLTKFSRLTYDFHPLEKAIEIMCSLVSKDMRKKEHSSNMYKLRRHLQSLLRHVEQNTQILERSKNACLLKALISHLHETAAAIMLNESPLFWKEADQHFKKALNHILPDVSKKLDAELSKFEKVDEGFVDEILQLSKIKAHELSCDFTAIYASKLEYSFEAAELEFLKSRSENESSFAEVEKLLSEKGSLKTVVEKLQNCKLFLSDFRYRSIFYAERFAFILHSWSRLVLYGDPEEVKEVGEKCIRMSDLSNKVSKECRKKEGIPLLAEHLSKFGGFIPILLKLKKPNEKLKKALLTCKEALHAKGTDDMYENGMIKEVYGPSNDVTRISLLRYIVRINARLHNETDEENVKEADKMCETLFDLSVKYADTISTCIMCFIYCAKYYAAKKDFDQAMKCFSTYFGLEQKCNPRFSTSCWAIYNYAKAVRAREIYLSGEKDDDNLPLVFDHKQQAVKRCSGVLQSKEVMNKNLKTSLKRLKLDLE